MSNENRDTIVMCIARFILLLSIPFGASAGCATRDPGREHIDADVWKSPHAAAVEHTETVDAQKGQLPLVYQVVDAATLRVTDETTGRQVALAPAKSGDIVSVDAQEGVHLAGRRLSGPLPADHRYSINLDFDADPLRPARTK